MPKAKQINLFHFLNTKTNKNLDKDKKLSEQSTKKRDESNAVVQWRANAGDRRSPKTYPGGTDIYIIYSHINRTHNRGNRAYIIHYQNN